MSAKGIRWWPLVPASALFLGPRLTDALVLRDAHELIEESFFTEPGRTLFRDFKNDMTRCGYKPVALSWPDGCRAFVALPAGIRGLTKAEGIEVYAACRKIAESWDMYIPEAAIGGTA